MTAILSPCRLYRYTLERELSPFSKRSVLFVMLNPSDASEVLDDPTIRRCMGFGTKWGFGSLLVGNLSAWRATCPRDLLPLGERAIGPDNDKHLSMLALRADQIICAWGANAPAARAAQVRAMFTQPVYHLGLTKDGHPKHPLYLKSSTTPQLWSAP